MKVYADTGRGEQALTGGCDADTLRDRQYLNLTFPNETADMMVSLVQWLPGVSNPCVGHIPERLPSLSRLYVSLKLQSGDSSFSPTWRTDWMKDRIRDVVASLSSSPKVKVSASQVMIKQFAARDSMIVVNVAITVHSATQLDAVVQKLGSSTMDSDHTKQLFVNFTGLLPPDDTSLKTLPMVYPNPWHATQFVAAT
jgi:hypothetical protein